jgi:hypothetical protein
MPVLALGDFDDTAPQATQVRDFGRVPIAVHVRHQR